MDEVKKMLRAVINGQSALKQELLDRIQKSDERHDKGLGKLEKRVALGFKEVNERLDKQGKQLAYLEDDAPTIEEHDALVKRVTRLEKRVTSVSS